MHIYRIARTEPIIWRIKAKVMGGQYNDLGVEIIASSIGEARNKFYMKHPDKANLYNSEHVVPEPDWGKTEIYRQKRKEEKKNAREQRKKKEDWWAEQQLKQFP